MKAASTVLTGGLGRRTARQRALILPTANDALGQCIRKSRVRAIWAAQEPSFFMILV